MPSSQLSVQLLIARQSDIAALSSRGLSSPECAVALMLMQSEGQLGLDELAIRAQQLVRMVKNFSVTRGLLDIRASRRRRQR